MSQQVIEILISPAGQSTVQTRGFSGSSCREASALIEEALGETSGERLTAEFYQAESKTQQTTSQS